MDIFVKRLDSGMRVAHKQISSPVAYCSLSIKAGTRNESRELNGMAHLTEHMLFKGTMKRGARRINNYLERLGGELNAFTTKEETVIHATVLKEDIGKAVELLADIVFNSVFPEKELLKEKIIVMDEISSYKDTPSEQIYDDFDEYVFGSHPLAMPILGTPESVEAIDSSAIRSYTEFFYQPSNMSFTIVADISERRGVGLIKKHFGERLDNRISLGKENICDKTIPELTCLKGEKYVSMNTFQANCVAGTSAYNLFDNRRIPLALLTNILGGPSLNSRLNLALREKHALAYSVDASYTPYSDTGLFTIYFGTDKSNVDQSLSLIDKELSLLRSKALSVNVLNAAKKQFLGQLAISGDNAENQCLAMGKSLLFYDEIETIGAIKEKIEAVDPFELLEIANEIFDRDKMFTLVYN